MFVQEQDVEAHEFVRKPTGVFLKCLAQGTTKGLKPNIEQGKPFAWVRIIEARQISKAEASKLFASKKYVATLDIVLYLMKN